MALIALLLAAGSALVWGTGDFAGGKASQRANALVVTVLAQAAGVPVIAILVVATGGGELVPRDLGWGAAAGMAGLGGLFLFYRGLGNSRAMAVVAPVTGVTAAVLPLAVGLVLDAVPPPLALLGVGFAIVSIALVSLGPRAGRGSVTWRTVAWAMLAGALFGLFFVLLAQCTPASGMWPLLGARAGSLGLGAVILAVTRTAPRLDRAVVGWVVVAGVFDITANAMYLAATQNGPLSIVAPIAALYPVSTVLLAFAVERERVRPLQIAGLGLAAAALVLTATAP